MRITVISRFFLYKALEIELFSGKDSTMPTGIKLFSEKHKNTWGNSVFLNVSRTHTHFRYRLVQLWFPTRHWEKFNCSLKQSTNTLGVTPSFKRVSHTHTLDTGWYRIGFPTKSLGKIELFSETKHKNTRRNTVF